MVEVERYINSGLLVRSPFFGRILPLIAFAALAFAQYLVFNYAPDEVVMGAAQRIMYFHVGSAMSCYLMIALLFFSSVAYLAKRKVEWEHLATASASVALLFCTVVLITGMIWGHSAWNTWWRWEPRLVSFLVLWLLLLSHTMTRSFLREDHRVGVYSSVIGVLAALNVPVVIFSIKILSRTEQLHPEVIAKQGVQDPRMITTLLFSIFALGLFSLWLFVFRLGNELLRAERLMSGGGDGDA